MKLITVTFYKLKMMAADRLFLAAMVLIPLLITVATGYALRYEKLNIIPVAFSDEDNTQSSRTLLERLSGKEGLDIRLTGREDALKMLENGEVEALFIIREGFEEKVAGGNGEETIEMVRSPSSYSADFLSELVAGEAMRFIANNIAADWVAKQYGKLGRPVDDELRSDVIRYADSQWEPQPLMTIRYLELSGGGTREAFRVAMPAATATSAGIIIVFVMFYILFSSGWLIEERINGTLKRLISGPGALGVSFAGSIMALFISGIVQIALFSAVDKIAFGVDLFPGGLSYLVFAAYLLAVISISMFLSSILRTPAQLQTGAPVLALLTGFVGGCFWNFVEMPERLQQLAMLTPQGWALKGVNGLLINPSDFSVVTGPVLVLLSISLILFPLSYIIINKNILK